MAFVSLSEPRGCWVWALRGNGGALGNLTVHPEAPVPKLLSMGAGRGSVQHIAGPCLPPEAEGVAGGRGAQRRGLLSSLLFVSSLLFSVFRIVGLNFGRFSKGILLWLRLSLPCCWITQWLYSRGHLFQGSWPGNVESSSTVKPLPAKPKPAVQAGEVDISLQKAFISKKWEDKSRVTLRVCVCTHHSAGITA